MIFPLLQTREHFQTHENMVKNKTINCFFIPSVSFVRTFEVSQFVFILFPCFLRPVFISCRFDFLSVCSRHMTTQTFLCIFIIYYLQFSFSWKQGRYCCYILSYNFDTEKLQTLSPVITSYTMSAAWNTSIEGFFPCETWLRYCSLHMRIYFIFKT